MGALSSDLRFAFRALRKAPAFSLAAIAALAIGIGPNTAIFSVVYATLLAPLPFPQPEQLVMVWSKTPAGNRSTVSSGDYLAWKESASSFQFLDPFSPRLFNLTGEDEPLRVRVRRVTPDGHRMLGEGMALGRDFQRGDDQPGRNQIVLLSNRTWRVRYAADPGIIGRDVRLDGRPYTVVGVLPPGPSDRLPADLWMPLTFAPEDVNHTSRTLLIKGRLKPGVSIEQAQHEMTSIAAALAQREPKSNKGWSVSVEPLQNNFLSAGRRVTLWLLLAVVAFVVAIACVNVANLLLARGTAREREMAIRTSMGASRARLIRQVLTESLVLAAAGGLLGVLSSAWILQGLLAVIPRGTLPAEADPRLSMPVLLFALLTTTVCGLLFGSAPAWQASRVDLNEVLKQSGRTSTGGGRRRLRQGLVVVELALAVTCLAGAGLAMYSFWSRTQVDLGIRTEHTLTFSLPVTREQLNTREKMDGFYRQLLDRLRTVPAVTDASVSTALPLQGTPFFAVPFHLAGAPACEITSCPATNVRMVTPGFFRTFGATIVRGRGFTDDDRSGGAPVALVSQLFADLFLRDVDPLRQRVELNFAAARAAGPRPPGAPVPWQVVGVFQTINNSEQLGEVSEPEIVLPFWQQPSLDAAVAVRTAGDPGNVRKDVAAAVRAIDPDLPLVSVRTMEEIVRERLASDRLNVALYGGLAAVALLLAALGVYGVMAFSVAQRTPEIGIRMALGAGQGHVRRQILREGALLTAGGLVLGVAGAYALGRAMQSTLFGTGALNVPVLLGVSAMLMASALAACYVPARRASAVDPMIALRQE
jgi:putative ABC transport system permease protein